MTLEDGTHAYGDVLVGADGIWSNVRKQIFGLGAVRRGRAPLPRRRRGGCAAGRRLSLLPS